MIAQVPALLCLLLLTGALSVSRGEKFPQCADGEPKTFATVVEDCASYIYCNGEDSFMASCPDRTYFDAKAQECAFDDAGFCLRGTATQKEEEEAVPEASAPEKVLPTIAASTAAFGRNTSPTSAAVGAPPCDTSTDSFHTHPQCCQCYYRCLSGNLTIGRCPDNYAWDHPKQHCEYYLKVQCYGSMHFDSGTVKLQYKPKERPTDDNNKKVKYL